MLLRDAFYYYGDILYLIALSYFICAGKRQIVRKESILPCFNCVWLGFNASIWLGSLIMDVNFLFDQISPYIIIGDLLILFEKWILTMKMWLSRPNNSRWIKTGYFEWCSCNILIKSNYTLILKTQGVFTSKWL